MFGYQSITGVLNDFNEIRTIAKNALSAFTTTIVDFLLEDLSEESATSTTTPTTTEATITPLNSPDTTPKTAGTPLTSTVTYLNTLAEQASIKPFTALLKKTLDRSLSIEEFDPDCYISKLLIHIIKIDAETVIELSGLLEIIDNRYQSTQLNISNKIGNIILSLDTVNIDILEKNSVGIDCSDLITARKDAIEMDELEKTYCIVTLTGDIEE
jgi:hypothetical protein